MTSAYAVPASAAVTVITHGSTSSSTGKRSRSPQMDDDDRMFADSDGCTDEDVNQSARSMDVCEQPRSLATTSYDDFDFNSIDSTPTTAMALLA